MSRVFETLWSVVHQAHLSTEFSRQEYWIGLPFPTAGDLLNPETEITLSVSTALAGRLFYQVAFPATWEAPYETEGEINDLILDVCSRMRKNMVFFPPHFFFDYTNVAPLVPGVAVLSCQPTCISHKHTMLINSLFAYHFASHWIPSVTKWKNPSLSSDTRWVVWIKRQ